MIYSTSEIESTITSVIQPYLEDGLIGGKFYAEGCRPFDSQEEDAVLAISDTDGEQIQNGQLRIKIYVPDIVVKKGGGAKMPNKARLEELSKLDDGIINKLSDELPDFRFEFVRATRTGQESYIQQHYIYINISFDLITF